MSILRAASWTQPRQVRALPRGARTTLAFSLIGINTLPETSEPSDQGSHGPLHDAQDFSRAQEIRHVPDVLGKNPVRGQAGDFPAQGAAGRFQRRGSLKRREKLEPLASGQDL